MQCVIVVACTEGWSLREEICNDPKIADFGLRVSAHMKRGRSKGWAKVHSTEGAHGAINIEWDSDIGILTCRVVTHKPGTPYAITGAFLKYLLTRHRKRAYAITIYPE